MAVSAEGVIQVALNLVPLVLAGSPPGVLVLAAASGLSMLASPSDVEGIANAAIEAAKDIANAIDGLLRATIEVEEKTDASDRASADRFRAAVRLLAEDQGDPGPGDPTSGGG